MGCLKLTYRREKGPTFLKVWKNEKSTSEKVGLYDYGARFYDASLARFHTLDPKAENYVFQSPYVYAANNPIKYIDVNGENPGVPTAAAAVAGEALLYTAMFIVAYEIITSDNFAKTPRTAAQRNYGKARSTKQTNYQKKINNGKNNNTIQAISLGVAIKLLDLYINMKETNDEDAFKPTNEDTDENTNSESNEDKSDDLVVDDNNDDSSESNDNSNQQSNNNNTQPADNTRVGSGSEQTYQESQQIVKDF